MAPGSNKRKRPDRQFSQEDGSSRPSPHRPENLGMAQQSQQSGGARGGRGGGGSRGQSRQGSTGANLVPVTPRNATSPTPAPQRLTPAVDSPRPETPSQTVSAISQPPAEEPSSPPAPYSYELITDDAVSSWQDGGRQTLEETAEEAEEETISTLVQELLRAALDGRLDATEAGAVIRHTTAHHSENTSVDVQSLFLNTLSLLDDGDTKNSSLLTLVVATEIDPEVIRQELDIPLLQALNLVRSTFIQMRTRKTTNILYRQANFNLLREETEGYAKLVTEYFNTANEAVGDRNVSAEAAFQRIKALVGSFDLDVGRVLDITLDISANLLVRAYAFFVKFYLCSSWWPDSGVIDNVRWEEQGFGSYPKWALPGQDGQSLSDEERGLQRKDQQDDLAAAKEVRDVEFWERVADVGMDAFFQLGARRIVDFEALLPFLESEVEPEYDARQKEINADRRKRINETRRYMRETRTLPPPGNSDAAQLLGFKLRFYASTARDAQDVLPDNLIYLAALLIKIGFVSLRDLYPHLYPSDEKMLDEKARLEKEKSEKEMKERPGGGANALAMAGALTDDTIPAVRALRGDKGSGGSTPKPDKKDDDAKDDLPAPTNQKIMLLKALLAIGALPEALYILGRFPWLAEIDVSLPPYFHRIAKEMLSKVADAVRPLGGRPGLQDASVQPMEKSAQPDGSITFEPRESKRITRWLGLDLPDKTDGATYRHYYSEWDDNIPICQSVDDVFLLCNTFVGYLGVKIGQDAALLTTLVQIAKHSLRSDASESNRSRWLDLMKRLLVPALSLSKHNPGLTQEVYELLCFFPTTTRYNIYAEWFIGKTSRLPDIRSAFDLNRAEVKDVLRRVTNESGKKQARALGKVSFSSPGVVMMNMINQLESYSNMIPSLVECARYFPLLAYDVLTWSLINALSGHGRDRIQADGMLTSPWLQALSQFMATLFRKYSVLNPSPVLQCLAAELRAGNSTDLEMFEQVLSEMAGIRPDMEFNDAQVLAMAGGEYMQAQTVLQLADKRHERKPTAIRLIEALAGPGLIEQTLIAIAQERSMYAQHDSSKFMPLKVLGNNLDKIQLVFAQYLDVLKTFLKPEQFEAALPDIVSLVGTFGLEPGIAFTVCRTAIVHRISEFDATKKRRSSSHKQSQVNGDVEMQEGDANALTNGHPPAPEDGGTEGVSGEVQPTTPDKEAKVSSTPQLPGTSSTDGEIQPWHPVLEPLIQQLPTVSAHLAERVSIPFYVTFWTLTLQDILVHTPSYDNEINKLRTQLKEVNADRSDTSTTGVQKRDRKKKELAEVQDRLRDELKGRIAAYQKTRNRLSRHEKDHWFPPMPTKKAEKEARHIGLLEECFLPRAMLSSLDAHYCFLMLKILHDNGTPGFSTVILLSELMKKQELAAMMFQCTAMEAQHFGRFLCETLKFLAHWHSDKNNYEKEGLGGKQKLPGFAVTLDANGEPADVVGFESFRRLLFNWHSFLAGALQMCFESGEYMHIRNGIIVLKSVVQVFPSLNFMGHNMVKHVTKIAEEDERQDLKLAARSLLGPLKNREKSWLMPQAFRLNDPSKEAGKAGSRAASARPETPQPTAGTPTLNAAAQEFKPTANGLANGTGRKEYVVGVEDGEIEDAKVADQEMKDAPEPKVDVQPEPKISESEESKEVTEAAPAPMTATTPAKELERPLSKPSTPAPIPAKPPPRDSIHGRPDLSRPSSAQPSHMLPSRPESRPPNKPLPVPPSDRSSGRYSSRSDDKYGRLDRPNDVRPPSRDHSPGGRSRPRTPERDPYYGMHAPARGPPRDDRGLPRSTADSRHPRDDPWATSRRDQPTPQPRAPYDSRDRSTATMGPPPTTHPDRAGYLSSAAIQPPRQTSNELQGQSREASRQQANSTSTQYHENPARLALINDDHAEGRDKGRDVGNDARRGRDARDERSAPLQSRHNDNRAAPVEQPRELQARMEQPTDSAPTGPRRGRLSRDLSSQAAPESSYGRLNSDAPSGPRASNGPSGRATRSFNAPQPSAATRNEQPASSSSASRAPESPAASRGPNLQQDTDQRGSGPQIDRQPSSNSVPTTPAAENGPSVHPSRMNQLGMQPPSIQTNLPANGSRNASSPTTAPPSGPRGSNRPPIGTPTGPSPVTAAPPSGPASGPERARRGDRQRANINATLQTANNGPVANGQSVSFRGAAQNRQTSMSMSSAASVAPVQAIASPLDPPVRRSEASQRPDLSQSRPESRHDLIQTFRGDGADGHGSSRRRDDGRGDYQRDSRNPNGERRPDDEPPQRPPPPGIEDTRERRSGVRDERRPHDDREAQRDSRVSERVPRNDDMPSRRPPPQQGPPSFSGPQQGWERDRRAPRGDGQDRVGRVPDRPQPVRGASRREEERRDDGRAPRDDGPLPPGGRKRRHEDAPPFDEAKRRRSGR